MQIKYNKMMWPSVLNTKVLITEILDTVGSVEKYSWLHENLSEYISLCMCIK